MTAKKEEAKDEEKKPEAHAEEKKHEAAHEHKKAEPAPAAAPPEKKEKRPRREKKAAEPKAEAKPHAHAAEEKKHEAAHEHKKAEPAPAAAPPEKKEKRPRRKKSSVVLARGKRKEAVARAVVSPGKGRFVFNRILLDSIPNRYVREIVKEPLAFVGAPLSAVDIKVYVRGGGQMGQAQAARTAIAKALVEYTGDEKLKSAYLEYDRSLLVEDVRRVEPKKYKGPKARARFQKSYR